MTNDSNLIWKNNCELLKNVLPDVFRKFTEQYDFFKNQVIFETLPDSRTHVKFISDNDKRIFTLHSKVDPYKEASRFIGGFEIDNTNNLLLLGLGLGYHLEEILSKPNKPDLIIVVEGNPVSFWALCHIHDISFIFNTKGLYFLFTPTAEELFRFFQLFTFSIIANGLKIIRHQSSYNYKKEYYNSLEKKIDGFSKWAETNISTQVRAANIFSKNILENVLNHTNYLPIKIFKDKFYKKPAFIVAGGPSLSKNGHLLQKVKGKGLIFTVDTSYQFLKHHNIEPHFIVSTDFTKNAKHYFDGIDSSTKSILLVDPEVCPEVIASFPGQKCFCNIKEKSICEWLNNLIEDSGGLEKGISVSHTAFNAALYMGADPIIFAGQDLAYSQGRTHVKGATHGIHIHTGEANISVKGVFGEVKTSNSLKVFLDHYEDIISLSSCTVIDATEGGAVIRGTQIKPLRQVICNMPDENIDDSLQKLITCGKKFIDINKIKDFFSQNVNKINSFIDITKVIQTENFKLQNIMQKEEIITDKFKQIYYSYKNHTNDLNKYSDINELIRDNMTEAFILKSKKFKTNINESGKFENKDEILNMLKVNLSYYKQVESAADIIKNQICEVNGKLK